MYALLTRLRLRWYALATGRVLMRHWQVLVIASLSIPTSTPVLAVLRFLASPVTAMFIPGRSLPWYLVHIGMIQAVMLAWVMLQRNHISSSDFMRYAAALPISTTLRRCVDLTMLLLTNSILLLPFVVAAISPDKISGAFHCAALGVLLSLVLVTQLAAFEKNIRAFPAILLADLLLGLGLSLPPGLAAWALLLLASLGIVSSLVLRKPVKSQLATTAQPDSMRLPPHWISPALRIQTKALFVDYRISTILRISMALGIAVAANCLIGIFEFDARSLPTAIIALAAMALCLGSIYRSLQSAHLPMRFYLAALPLKPHYWAARDTLFVMLLGMVPLGMLLIPLLGHNISLSLAMLALAYQILLALLRLPLLFGGRQVALLSFLMAGVWSGLAIAAIQ